MMVLVGIILLLKATARQKMIDAFTALIDQHLYLANSYGSRWQEEDDNG